MNKILYKNEDIELYYNKELLFNYNNKTYTITSHPYEPCLYISFNDKIVYIIHNSFEKEDIINNNLKSISGKEYNTDNIVQLLIYTINNNIYESDISLYESSLLMSELKDDVFYKEYKKYNDCVLDYIILKNNSEYNNNSHKNALVSGLNILKKRLRSESGFNLVFNINKMKSKKINSLNFIESTDTNSYYYMFLNPPHLTNYNKDDFIKINKILFPNGFNNLEIYKWSTDWSNYFLEGLEWWGTLCVSIYDRTLDRFVIILASATD